MRRLAFYGGSFDPVHRGHLAIARALVKQFALDEFVLIPAFHAPHKVRLKPTSAYDRYAMLCLATQAMANARVSRIEIEVPEKPYSIETLTRLKSEFPDDELFFVMGADSWRDIKTWREWERVLSIVNIIVVTRLGVEIGVDHVTDEIRSRIVDLRETKGQTLTRTGEGTKIYFTDVVNTDISATDIRRRLREDDPAWRDDVTSEVANYIEKYQIYR